MQKIMLYFKSPNNKQQPALLILDIDETLLHASTYPLAQPCDYKAERTWVYKRPYVDEFLKYCEQFFTLAIWTSARASYAYEICSNVFPTLTPVFIYSEKHCLTGTAPDGTAHSIKPLKRVEQLGFNLKRVLIIDDSVEKLSHNPMNLLAIAPFYPKSLSNNKDSEDSELKNIQKSLEQLKHEENFLVIEKNNNKIHHQYSRA